MIGKRTEQLGPDRFLGREVRFRDQVGGTFLADGETEFKFYAPGVGVVREVPAGGDVVLKSHTAR